MIFVTGPMFSGKKTYLKNRFGWNEEELVQNAACDVQDLLTGSESAAQLEALAEKLAAMKAVTAAEVGGGVVPADPEMRAQREAAGRLSVLLAQRAQEAVRVFCGLPTKLK